MEVLCGFQRPQQSDAKGQISDARSRNIDQRRCRSQNAEFMDGNASYNHIFMALEDISKTAFRVPGAVGLFEYLVMTFGLKNTGATYQRVMNYIFHDLIGKLVEIYIDDVVVKSKSAGGHLEDLRQVFGTDSKVWAQNEPKEVCLRCIGRSIFGIPGA